MGVELSKRVLFVLKNFSQGGGVERIVLNLAQQLSEEGFEVLFFVFKSFPQANDIGFETLIPEEGLLNKIFSLIRCLKTRKIDVVISAKEQANILVKLVSLFVHRFKPIYTRHSALSTSDQMLSPIVIKLLYNIYLLGRGSVVTVSESIKNTIFESLVFGKSRIVSIPNPIITKELYAKSSVNSDGLNIQGEYICGAGRLCNEKGFDLLIDAYAQLIKLLPDCPRLLIAGEGAMRESLQNKISEHGLSGRIELIGFLKNPYFFMKNSSVFVLSSRFEGLPTVLVEAMALKVPVVAFDCPTGPREILNSGEHGELVNSGDVSALSKAMARQIVKRNIASPQAIVCYEAKHAVNKYIKLI